MAKFFIDLAERVGFTFIFVFVTTIYAASTGLNVDRWQAGLLTAAFSALITLGTTLLAHAGLVRIHDPKVDLLYRVVTTFGQSLLGLMLAATTSNLITFDWDGAVKVACGAALASLLKALSGFRDPSTMGAARFTPAP